MTDLTSGATNYNDGRWYGWNGGECPVHPETIVEVIIVAGAGGERRDRKAETFAWGLYPDHNIVAFRVIKEYKEPREVYKAGGTFFHTRAAAESYTDAPITVFREVME